VKKPDPSNQQRNDDSGGERFAFQHRRIMTPEGRAGPDNLATEGQAQPAPPA
jgi:hypothetical protein